MTYFGILCIMIQIIVLSRKDEILVYRYTPSELKQIQGMAALKKGSPLKSQFISPSLVSDPKTWWPLNSSAHLQLWQAWWNLEIALRWLHICTRRGQRQTTKRTGKTHFHVRQRHLSHRSSNCSLQGHIRWGRPGPRANNKHLDNLVGLEADLTNIHVKVDAWSCNTTNTLDQIQLCSKLEFTSCLGPFPHEPRPKTLLVVIGKLGLKQQNADLRWEVNKQTCWE